MANACFQRSPTADALSCILCHAARCLNTPSGIDACSADRNGLRVVSGRTKSASLSLPPIGSCCSRSNENRASGDTKSAFFGCTNLTFAIARICLHFRAAHFYAEVTTHYYNCNCNCGFSNAPPTSDRWRITLSYD